MKIYLSTVFANKSRRNTFLVLLACETLSLMVYLYVMHYMYQTERSEPITQPYLKGERYYFSENSEIKFPDGDKEKRGHGVTDAFSVAIGLALTTRVRKGELKDIGKHVFFSTFLSSFCATASTQYSYNFYIALDFNDPLLSRKDQVQRFRKLFVGIRNDACENVTSMGLNFVNCSHTRKPAWAQNDAMMSAYMDDNDYLYRINDDTIMVTKGWTEIFIKKLLEYDPPNMGVVGPNHSGGRLGILTYDFVHRTHVDVFGFYYPRIFVDFHADRWITEIYKPGRSTKVKEVKLKHTMSKGTRYSKHAFPRDEVSAVIARGQKTLKRFVEAKESKYNQDNSRIIAMSLIGNKSKDLYGVIRNIMLRPIYFPSWTVRVYLEKPIPLNDTMQIPRYPDIPNYFSFKLERLPVQIAYVNTQDTEVDPSLWPALGVDDESVDFLLVRKATSRLSDRDAGVVDEWMDSGKVVHVIRDHPKHTQNKIVPGLWGVNAKKLRAFLGQRKLSSLLVRTENEASFLNDVLWPKLVDQILCHDSISSSNDTRQLPLARINFEYLGEEFGLSEQPLMDQNESFV